MPNDNVIPFAAPGRIRGRAEPRRAIERKGCLSNGSTQTTVRKRVSSSKRKGVGDSLAGARNSARRHNDNACCATRTSARCRDATRRTSCRRESSRPARRQCDSRVTFETLANQWQATVLPMYKASTQKNHRHILSKHLLPRFGQKSVADVTRQEIQAYVARPDARGYAPKSIDHMHDVLSAILRTAVKWGHLSTILHAASICRRSQRSGRSGR